MFFAFAIDVSIPKQPVKMQEFGRYGIFRHCSPELSGKAIVDQRPIRKTSGFRLQSRPIYPSKPKHITSVFFFFFVFLPGISLVSPRYLRDIYGKKQVIRQPNPNFRTALRPTYYVCTTESSSLQFLIHTSPQLTLNNK